MADRFKLAVHHDSKQVSAYTLVIAKGGQKLPKAERPREFFTARPGLISGTQVSMREFAGALSRLLDRPVADETALTALYDLTLEWTPDDAPPSPTNSEASEPGPSLFSALQDQLGLRLQTQKVSVDIVIVDHVEKLPTEN